MAGEVKPYETARGRRWRIDYELPPDPSSGERRRTTRRGFTTKREAERALRETLGAIEDGTHVERSTVTVAAYLRDEWLAARRPRGEGGRRSRGSVSEATWEEYRKVVEHYVVPAFGGVRLQELRPVDITRLYDELERTGGRSGTGRSPKTLANIHGVLHKALDDAVRLGRLTRNPVNLVDAPRPGRARTAVWDVAELRRFLEHVREDRLYAMWLVFATTGMRRGEVIGLSWDDVDLESGSTRVSWTLGMVGGKPAWKPLPKTKAGERTLALDPATVEALRAWRRAQLEERLAAGPAWREVVRDTAGRSRERVVFTWPDGRFVHPDRVYDWFKRHVTEAGLRLTRLHDVRHAYATAALQSATGWHEVKVLSQRLGHASVGTTLDIYAHALPAADAEQAHTLARLILGSP